MAAGPGSVVDREGQERPPSRRAVLRLVAVESWFSRTAECEQRCGGTPCAPREQFS